VVSGPSVAVLGVNSGRCGACDGGSCRNTAIRVAPLGRRSFHDMPIAMASIDRQDAKTSLRLRESHEVRRGRGSACSLQ